MKALKFPAALRLLTRVKSSIGPGAKTRLPIVAVATLALVGCGGGGSSSSSTAPANSTVVPASPPMGEYAARLTTAALAAAGVDTVNVGPGGLWHLSITPHKMTLTPPPPETNTTVYPVASVTKARLTLGGERACSVVAAQTQKSVYKISSTAQGLRFAAVNEACKEDGGILTAGAWMKQ